MKENLPKQISLEDITQDQGDFLISILGDLSFNGELPRRMYILQSGKDSSLRGNHAHRNQYQVLYLKKGQAFLKLESQRGEIYTFDLREGAVFIPRNHWIELEMYPQTDILCLASQKYEDTQTIKDKAEFNQSR